MFGFVRGSHLPFGPKPGPSINLSEVRRVDLLQRSAYWLVFLFLFLLGMFAVLVIAFFIYAFGQVS
jgi:hypothetical protein